MNASRFVFRFSPLALAGLMAIAGCLSTRTDSPVAEQFDSLGTSLAGIRQSNIRAAYRTGLAIEQAADSIITSTTDQTIRVNAYLWKIYSIPVIRQIYSHSDPIAAAIDALAFAVQCEQYFDTGLGRNRFGDYQLIAIATSAGIQDNLIEGMRTNLTTTNFDTLTSLVSSWAKEHPLMNHVFSRPSATKDMDKILAQRDQSIGSAVGRIADNVDDLSARLALFGGQIPREARWQGEYLLIEYGVEERLNTLDTTIAVLTSSMVRIEKTLTEGKATVDIKGLRYLHGDILAALEFVRAERTRVIAEVERQRLETLAGMKTLVKETIDDASEQAEGIINRALWKIGLIVAVALLGAALVILLARALWRPRM